MYRVGWLQSALNELADIWVHADAGLRQAITSAAHQIEQLLRRDPLTAGESRPSGRRILFVSPLGVTFRIDHASQTVTVVRVWLFRKRSQP